MFNWTVVENKCIKWQTDSVYLVEYLKTQLGWVKKGETKDLGIETGIQPNTHGILKSGNTLFVVYIHPKNEWRNNKPKIHWMNTKDKDFKTAKFKYTYEDKKDNKEVWKKDNKEYKQFQKITAFINVSEIIMNIPFEC